MFFGSLKFLKVARTCAVVADLETSAILSWVSSVSWASTKTSQSILPTSPSGVPFKSLSTNP